MRWVLALVISVPAWMLCYILLAQRILCTDEWPDLVVLLTLIVLTVFASAVAFLRCDLRVSRRATSTNNAPDRVGARANSAFFLAGLALGLFPTLIWATQLIRQRDEVREVAGGIAVIMASEDLKPGDTLSIYNVGSSHILRKNLTDFHFYTDEVHKLMGAKATVFIPARTPVLVSHIEGAAESPRPKMKVEESSLKDLRY